MINRREFATAAVCGLSGLTAPCRPKEDIIDIHQHLRYKGRSNADFISHQKAMGKCLAEWKAWQSAYKSKSIADEAIQAPT